MFWFLVMFVCIGLLVKWVINLSKKELTPEEKSLLQKGPKFAVISATIPIKEYISTITVAALQAGEINGVDCSGLYHDANRILNTFTNKLQKIHQASGIHYHQLHLLLQQGILKTITGCSHVFTCLPCHCKYLHGILWILSHSLISNINQVVVQVCWWCPQCHQERSSQHTSRASQFHRSTHHIHHRTPRNRWTPLPRYPDQTHSIESTENPPTQIGT